MQLRCATLNVLADAYLGYGDYGHVDPELLAPKARLPFLLRLIDDLQVDVLGLQEVETPLLTALDATNKWQSFWSQKRKSKPDGCLMLVKQGIDAEGFETHAYQDDSGQVMQSIRIGEAIFANTHIKWAPDDDPHHAGILQTRELLEQLGSSRPAVIFADCNDRPNGPIRALINAAGFTNINGDEPTALVNQEQTALDLLAVRSVHAERIETGFRPINIPHATCPSDHIPVLASLEI